MSVRKEDQEEEEESFLTFENFKSLFRPEEEVPQQEDNSFSSMARQLRITKEEELEETQGLQRDVTDWFAGVAMEKLHMTGTALGARIQNMIMGDSTPDNDGE
jgi:hypothetical protein